MRRVSLLRDRSFAKLFGGETISELGSAITGLVFPLIAVQTLHASAIAVGVVAAAGNAAWLVVALPAGAWVDRVRRRPILIATDIGSAVLLATVPVAAVLHVLSVAQLIAVGFGLGLLGVVFDVAYPAFLPSVVPAERLVEGNGLLEASANGARIAGPSVGGILVQLIGAPVALLADAVSFVISATAVASMRVTEARPVGETPIAVADVFDGVVTESSPSAVDAATLGGAAAASGGAGASRRLRHEIMVGLRFVFANATTRALTAGVTVANFIFGAYGAVDVVFLARQLGISAGVIGLLFAVGGVGGIVGALVAGPIAARIGDARLLWTSTVFSTPFVLFIPLTRRGVGLTWFVVGSLMLSVGIAAFNVCARAAIQRTAPPAVLGRVTASIRVFSRGALPVGAVVGGVLADLTTPRMALTVMLSLYGLVPLVLWMSPIGRVRFVAELAVA